MKSSRKTSFITILIGALVIFFLYRQQNIIKREEESSATQSGSEICSLDYAPVCGEDKVTYANECAARKNAMKIAYSGTCRTEESNTGSIEKSNSGAQITSFSGKTKDQYYNEIEAQCGDDTCCVGSARTMRVGEYLLANEGECQPGEKINSADCAGSLQWCEPGSTTTQNTIEQPSLSDNGVISPTLQNIAPEGKRTPYYNAANNYGFSVPVGDYFSGFGARDGASHTVGINTGTGVTSFENAQVKVYYYKTTPSEIAGSEKTLIQSGNKSYLKLSVGTLMVEGDPTGKTVSTILSTAQNGSGSIVPQN